MSERVVTPPPTSLSDPPSPTEFAEYGSSRRPSNNPFNYPPAYQDDSDDEHRSGTPMAPSATAIVKTTMTTIVPITFHPKPIYVVVATALNPPMGIGSRGTLPWAGIKGDMAFFRKLTSNIPGSAPSGSLNAAIMGRKTWESIPVKFRPLGGRLNVIITRSKVKELGRRILEELQASSKSWEVQDLLLSTAATPSRPTESNEGPTANTPPSSSVLLTPSSPTPESAILISSSLPSALSLLSSSSPLPNTSITPHKIFCIGGANIYQQVLALSHSPQTDDDDEDLSPTTTREAPAPDTSAAQETEDADDADSAAFDVRVIQTQVHKLNGEAFDCDTFFSEDLTFATATSQWRAVSPKTLDVWVDGIEVPGSSPSASPDSNPDAGRDALSEDDDDDESDGWVRDDKAGVEFRVVGWERR